MKLLTIISLELNNVYIYTIVVESVYSQRGFRVLAV